MSRKPRTDSVKGQVESMRRASREVQPPEGVELRSDDECLLWRQFTKARPADVWRDFDLLLVAKIVRTEIKIREYEESLNNDGPLIENKRGTQIENPLLRAIDVLQRQQLAIIRSMSLNQTEKDPRTLAKNASQDKDSLRKLKSDGVDSLIAMPDTMQ